MQERIITAAILIAIIVGIVFFLPVLFTPVIAIMLGISIWEWCRIAQIRRPMSYYVAAATIILWLAASIYPAVLSLLLLLSALHYIYAIRLIRHYEQIRNFRIPQSYLRLVGPVLLAALAASMVYIFNYRIGADSEDAMTLTYIIMLVAAADSGAYFIGRFFGKHQLAPRVSPKKTWEGLIGGFISVLIVVAAFHFMLDGWYLSLGQILLISIVAALYSVIGDLFISIIKRQNGIKDASQILPGHGGVLDRIDGLLAAIPVFYFLQQII